jgi:hypothetical protein
MPRHTLLIHPGGHDTPKDLTDSTPVSDKNVVYVFRFFDPVQFTTQWLPGSPIQEQDKVTLPYPATASSIVSSLANLSDEAKDWAMTYAKERWSSDLMTEKLRPIGDWASKRRVRVVCDAFGVSQKVAPEDRSRYFSDLRKSFEAIRVGWCVTQYVGPYGLFSGSPGNRHADSGVLPALGKSG